MPRRRHYAITPRELPLEVYHELILFCHVFMTSFHAANGVIYCREGVEYSLFSSIFVLNIDYPLRIDTMRIGLFSHYAGFGAAIMLLIFLAAAHFRLLELLGFR